MTEIGWGRLRKLTARQIINALIRDGFVPPISVAPTNAIITQTAGV